MKIIKYLLILPLFVSGCVSEFLDTYDKVTHTTGVQWNPTLAVPLVYSDVSIKDVLEEGSDFVYVRVESDGGVSAIYRDNVFSRSAEEAIDLDDQNVSENFVLSGGEQTTLTTTGSVVLNRSVTLSFDFDGDEVDLVRYKAGDLTLGLSHDLQHDVQASISEVNNSIAETTSANYGGSVPSTSSSTRSMIGKEVDFTLGSQGHSQLTIDFTITITEQSGNPLTGTESIDITILLEDQEFSYLEGLFDNFDLSGDGQQIGINVFDGAIGGEFTLADPQIKIIFTNSMGVPIDANITQFDGTNKDNNTVSLTGYPSPLPIPTLDFTEIGQSKSDSFVMNRNNSNIVDYLDNQPSTNDIDATMITNPMGSSPRNWFIDTSVIEVATEIVVPIHGTAKNFFVETTQPFELELEGADQIKEVLFRLFTVNGFPIDIHTQVYFEDSASGQVLDSLLGTDRLIMPAAEVDGTGKVNLTFPKTIDLLFDEDRVSTIELANQIRIVSEFNTTEQNGSQPDVKFYEDYSIHLELGVQAEILLDQEL